MSSSPLSRDYVPSSPEAHKQLLQQFVKSSTGLSNRTYKYKHTLVDGVYMRQLWMPKGMIMAGVIHKRETTLMLVEGSIQVFSVAGIRTMKAFSTVISPPGTQRVAKALTDTTLITVHRADSYDLGELIQGLVECEDIPISGLDEGDYRLYINGTQVIHEKIQSNRDRTSIQRRLQQLPHCDTGAPVPDVALHDDPL